MASAFPRVTEILADTGLGPDLLLIAADVLERARVRGQRVHAAIEALTYGFYEPAEHDPDGDLGGYLGAYRKFVAEAKYEPLAAEVEVVHEAWRYCGHPDTVGFLGKHRVILDFKSGMLGLQGVEYQLAGYTEAWNHQRPRELVSAAAAVELRPNETYRYHEVDLGSATPVWYAAVTVYHARQRRAA